MLLLSSGNISYLLNIFFTFQPETVLRDGENLHLQCSYVPADDQDLIVEWTKDSKAIEESSRLKTISDFGFVMIDLAKADSRDTGRYECRISNK